MLLLATLTLLSPSAALASPDTGPTAPAPGPGAQDAEPPQVTFTYAVTAEGEVATDRDAFAADVDAILSDARGWTLGGSIAFTSAASGPDLTVVLASPQVVEDAAPVCSRHYSCRVGDRVYINDRNWREATPAWNDSGAPRWLYREYLINHEVGHYLGEGHRECGDAGPTAPVMQQQSISLDGCDPNGWPVGFERDRVADRFGVPVYAWVFRDVLASHPHRTSIHEAAEAGVVRGYDDGTFRPGREVTRAQLASLVARALDLEAEGPPPFDDVAADDVHADAIAATAEADIVTGYGDATFRPVEGTTRAQMASVLARAYELDAEAEEPPFDDVPAHHPHAEGITAVAEAGVAVGYDDGTYRPDGTVTRGQLASFLDRAGT